MQFTQVIRSCKTSIFVVSGFTMCFVHADVQGFLRHFRDPIWVPRIRENYDRVPKIREIGSLHIHTGYLTFFFKKTCRCIKINNTKPNRDHRIILYKFHFKRIIFIKL